ncbi:protein SMG7 isoform X1 [Hippoglossus hippoglossus]|uniref:protein SMG7 isoform X1 n=1 Tax=Hippoglossus hippoglossus TaxID=8267 RepID=UPI00148C1B42|nr:protein SMG7 isoform X1 [Hippoglossus hippoglossus]XP_035025547.1 nonsense-mediated mRNA decay factor SMG7 isoform X1 [Hippoglossus stenolepis]
MTLCAQYLRQAEALKADMTDSKLGAAEVWTSRQALQDLYQKMLVTDLEYALDKKVEQDLWNHAFKNQITTLQSQAKNRANPNRSEVQANLSLFLEAASGFYTQLLQELCTVFNVDLPCRVKSSQLGIISNKQSNTSGIVSPQPSSCSYICQHCLVHLGDIARYRNQTSQAESYYRHAAQLVPSNGQPYNQLAILASSKGDHLTTIFYYCRSIAVKFPFPAASTNLQKALSKALESREEGKTKWSVSDFIKAFIKFHGHVYLSKSLDKVDALREKLEEQFQRLILQKAFSSQQLVHITVINLFELHHLRDLTCDGSEPAYSSEQQISWFQLLGLFMSFLGVMCSRVLLNKTRGEDIMGECPLPAIKVSLDWLKLKPSVFHEAAVDQRQHVWPWLVSILNSFQPQEYDVSCSSVTPLPEEFELQGFLALRPALRSLDFTKGHQGILVDRDGPPVHTRHQRLISLGKWVADNQPGLIQCRVSEDGLLLFITDIPEQAIEEPQEREAPVLQESSNGEQMPNDGGNSGLKSVLSAGKTQSSWPDSSDRPVVTFKENIKPREQSREMMRNPHQKDGGKERRDFGKGNGAAGKGELKRDGKRKSELKKTGHEKTTEAVKQVKAQTELRKTPVSEVKKTPVTQTQTTCSSQFIPIHHPGAFPPLPSRPGFPPSAYVIPPPVAFPGLQVNPGFTFSTGVSVPGPFLQPAAHTQAGTQVQAGKQSHIPYSQQRPSGPGPGQGPGSMNQSPSQGQQPLSQPPSQQALQQSVQLQVQTMSQQQQSPTRPVQQVGIGKSPPHLPGLQQYMQVQDQPAQIWNQAQAALQKMNPMQMSMKQQPSQTFFMASPDPLKLYEHQLQPQLSNMDKKIKFPDAKMQDFYWEPSYRMGDGLAVMADRMKRPPPGGICSEQDGSTGPRGPPFEDKSSPLLPPDLLKSLADFEEEEELVFSKPPDFFQALAAPLSSAPGPNMFLSNQTRMESGPEVISQSSSLLPISGFPMQEYNQNSIFSQAYGKTLPPSSKPDAPMMHQEPSLYSLFEGTPWSPSLPASSDHSTPASQSPHSSNPSSLPSSPPTHNHGAMPFSNFGPIGTPDSRDRRVVDRWKADKTGAVSGFGLDYLPAAASSAASDTSWHQSGPTGSSWTNQESPMEESSSTVLLDSLKSIWSSSMMQPGPSALEQLLLQQKQKQQRGHGAMNPPH